MTADEKDGVEASVTGSALGTNFSVRAAGVWAAPTILTGIVFGLLLWGDESHRGTQLAIYLALVLLGANLGVAFTFRRVEDWRTIAEERKREIDRMADEKNALVELKRRRSSAGEKGKP